MRLLASLILLFALTCGFERNARAGESSVFALIVTSNRSVRLSRPDLRYADDDGARYYEMFRMVAPESNLVLLSAFDRDTAKLFPALVEKTAAPSKAHVTDAARALRAKVDLAKSKGPVDFYFIFAGHGDVEGGKGFLELSDAPFTSDDLEALIQSIPATRTHVILDSCNSFFVVNSRKPGGRHFMTSDEAIKSVSQRLPNVGLFLSTSAEGEVYEWSDLQSGVFSHAVRSGLSGAADVNGDGRISYDELRAFVGVASMDVKNPAYRPQVFARGPAGHGADVLLDVSRAKAHKVKLDGAQRRLTMRDQNDLPWFDLNKEAGSEPTILVPPTVAAGGAVEELDPASGAARHRYGLGEADDASLTMLSVTALQTTPRGADQVFRSLFAHPFGPRAFAQFQSEQELSQPAALGVSAEERDRLGRLLHQSADSSRRTRILYGSIVVAAGLGMGTAGGLELQHSYSENGRGSLAGWVGVGAGAGFVGLGLYRLARTTLAEETYDTFTRYMGRDTKDVGRSQRLYSWAEESLLASAAYDRRRRSWTRWLGAGGLAASGVVLGIALASDTKVSAQGAMLIGTTGLLYGAVLLDSFFPSPTERMADLWKSEPSNAQHMGASRLTIRPVLGLMSGGITGSF